MEKGNKKSLIMLVSGLVLIVISIGIFIFANKKETKAIDTAGHTWAEEWSSQEWRVVRPHLVNNSWSAARDLVIGPAKWTVQGTIDSQNYTETWTVLHWQNNPGQWNDVAYDYTTVPSSGASGRPLIWDVYRPWEQYNETNAPHRVYSTTGTYGGNQMPDEALNNFHEGLVQTFSSWPTSWKVYGDFE